MDILYVSATKQEASALTGDVPLLITGIGTVNAAIAVSSWLAAAEKLPDLVINFGTAGALVDGWHGVFEISHTFQHDFDHELLSQIAGYEIPNGIDLWCTGGFPTARLATGNSFIGDSDTRARLSALAQVCDMEGYAVAAACQAAGVPCSLIKQVSDTADEQAATEWSEAANRGATDLAAAVMRRAALAGRSAVMWCERWEQSHPLPLEGKT